MTSLAGALPQVSCDLRLLPCCSSFFILNHLQVVTSWEQRNGAHEVPELMVTTATTPSFEHLDLGAATELCRKICSQLGSVLEERNGLKDVSSGLKLAQGHGKCNAGI